MAADTLDADRRTNRALRNLGATAVPEEDGVRLEARRDRVVPALERFAADGFAARARKKRVQTRIALAISVAAAALVGLGVGTWRARTTATASGSPALRSTEGDVRIERDGRALGVASSMPFALGAHDRVETHDGRASVSLVTRATVDLEPRSELELFAPERDTARIDEKIALIGGKIGVRVPKLGAGSRLQVDTPDAIVTVHGTAFSVEVEPGATAGTTVTTVAVTEGRVSVKSAGREIFLDPGATWSSLPVAQPAPETDPEEGDAEPENVFSGAARAYAKRSTLGEENALFRDAISARRAGDPRHAVELLNQLLTRYPTSPLAAEARAARAGALEAMTGAARPGSE